MTYTLAVVTLLLAAAAVPPSPRTLSLLRRGGPGRVPTTTTTTALRVHSPSSPGADALGFSDALYPPSAGAAYQLGTQVLFGANALEHGVNLLEARSQRVLVVSGWNVARVDPVMWELEPRGFHTRVVTVPVEPSAVEVLAVVAAAAAHRADTLLAVGGGSVLDASKMAATLLNRLADEDIARLTADDVDRWLVGAGGGGGGGGTNWKGAGLPRKDVLCVTVPSLPCAGAELSRVAALRSRALSPAASACAGDKTYVAVDPPAVALVQPGLARRAPMELLHDRVVALVAAAVDVVLADPGFLPEMLAWDALRQLMPLLDHAVQKSRERFTAWARDPRLYESLTVHDDEADPEHRTQYHRRYGQSLSPALVSDLCRAGAAVAAARAGTAGAGAVGGLQWLSDTLGALAQRGGDVGHAGGATHRAVQLFPHYLAAVLAWTDTADSHHDNNDDSISSASAAAFIPGAPRAMTTTDAAVDPYKAFIRTKLDRVSEVFEASACFGGGADAAPSEAGAVDTGEPASRSRRLRRQLRSLRRHLRLLAGPQQDPEPEPEPCYGFLLDETEGEVVATGDALTDLMAALRAQGVVWGGVSPPRDGPWPGPSPGAEPSNDVDVDGLFEGYALEEGEAVASLIGGYDPDDGDDGDGDGDGERHPRLLPPLARPLVAADGHRLRLRAREACGAAPVAHLAPRTLLALLSLGGVRAPTPAPPSPVPAVAAAKPAAEEALAGAVDDAPAPRDEGDEGEEEDEEGDEEEVARVADIRRRLASLVGDGGTGSGGKGAGAGAGGDALVQSLEDVLDAIVGASSSPVRPKTPDPQGLTSDPPPPGEGKGKGGGGGGEGAPPRVSPEEAEKMALAWEEAIFRKIRRGGAEGP